MEQTPATPSHDLTRPFVILGVCLIVAGATMALGFWLAFERAVEGMRSACATRGGRVKSFHT